MANEPDRMLRVYADLLDELRKRLVPRNVRVAPLVIAQDVADLARKVKHADVDMVVETAFATFALEDQSEHGVTPRLAIVRRNQRTYHTVFFTRKDSPVQKLEDLRGRTIVLQADRSTSAYAVPKAEIGRRGIRLVLAGQVAQSKASAFYLFAGAELNQAVWVLNGKGDAGAFNEIDWASLPAKMRAGLRIFHETPPLLRGLLSFRTGLDARTKAICEEVLLGLDKDPTGRAALDKAAGVTRMELLTSKDVADLAAWRVTLKGASR
ncbi:MAG: PhnD/SsuA/transferrin family substrate-binding protein [Vicinamibacteria bacterium]